MLVFRRTFPDEPFSNIDVPATTVNTLPKMQTAAEMLQIAFVIHKPSFPVLE